MLQGVVARTTRFFHLAREGISLVAALSFQSNEQVAAGGTSVASERGSRSKSSGGSEWGREDCARCSAGRLGVDAVVSRRAAVGPHSGPRYASRCRTTIEEREPLLWRLREDHRQTLPPLIARPLRGVFTRRAAERDTALHPTALLNAAFPSPALKSEECLPLARLSKTFLPGVCVPRPGSVPTTISVNERGHGVLYRSYTAGRHRSTSTGASVGRSSCRGGSHDEPSLVFSDPRLESTFPSKREPPLRGMTERDWVRSRDVPSPSPRREGGREGTKSAALVSVQSERDKSSRRRSCQEGGRFAAGVGPVPSATNLLSRKRGSDSSPFTAAATPHRLAMKESGS